MIDEIAKGNIKISQQNILVLKDQFIEGFKQYISIKKSFLPNKILFRPFVAKLDDSLDEGILAMFKNYDFIIQYLIPKTQIRSIQGKKPIGPMFISSDEEGSKYRFQKQYSLMFEIFGTDYDKTFQVQDELFDYQYLFKDLNIESEYEFLNIDTARASYQQLINGTLVYSQNVNLDIVTNVDISEYQSIIRSISISSTIEN